MAAAQARVRIAREERDQFEEANKQIIEHLKTKEEELSNSIASCQKESDVIKTWINFLEDTWVLQRSNAEINEKQVNDELEKHEEYYVNLAIQLLASYKEELEPSINHIGTFVENLKNLSQGSEVSSNTMTEDSEALNPRKNLEEEYLAYESKIITTFSVVDNMKQQFYAQQGKISRKDEEKVIELFDAIAKLRAQFESIERPNLELENPAPKTEASPTDKQHDGTADPAQGAAADPSKVQTGKKPKSPTAKSDQVLDHETELAKLESEFGGVGQEYSREEIGDWEFDELERELTSGDSAKTH